MKKALIVITIIVILIALNISKKDYVIVPDNSIRFRIIPNSNALEDINVKEKVKDAISETIGEIEKTDNINDSRKRIINSIDIIDNKISSLFKSINYDKTYKINYGLNYFPNKIYKGVKYPEGNYESLVIEIGQASGDNFWCVLFPPLCMIDETSEDVEYKFFIKEIIDKFIKKG